MFNPASRMEALPFSEIRVMMERATQMQKNGEDVIHMEIGRPDFDTPEIIKQAANTALANGNVFYTSNYGTPELRQAIADKLKRDNGIDYKAEEILVTIGVGEGTYAAVAAFTEPGDEILVPDPVWLNYIHVPHFFGAVPVSYKLREENDYQIDLNEIEGLITPKTRMLVINTPGNPTGVVQSRETLEKLADIAKKHDLIVVSDEIYEKLVYDGARHVSIAALPGMKERTITLNGFSKCYSMTGWRLGYLATDRKLLGHILRVHQYSTTCSPTFIQVALAECMNSKQTQKQITEMLEAFSNRRKLIMSLLDEIPALSYSKPYGAFYIMVDVSRLGMTAMEFSMKLLEEKYVATVPAVGLDEHTGKYVRFSYATSEENIVEGLARVKKMVEELHL